MNFIKLFTYSLIAVLFAGNLYSQEFSRQEITAAYIYNFAKNIEWKDEEKINEFHFIIISGNNKLINELKKISSEKRLRDKKIKFTSAVQLTGIKDIHLVFVSKENNAILMDVFDKIEGKNILLVSEEYENKKSVMINFYETKDQTLRFEINKANIINQGLTILPDMVLLGGSEIDVAALYRESQLSLRTLQKQLEELQLHEQKLTKKIEASETEIKKQQQLINTQTAFVDSQKTQLMEQNIKLKELLSEITKKQDTLKLQTAIIEKHESELNEQKKEILRRENVLSEQKVKIDSQNIEIEKQTKSLEEQGATISEQKNILYLLLVIALLGIGLSVSIYRGYKNKYTSNKLLTKEIEERKKIEEALGRSEDLYNNAPCGYHSLDSEGMIVQINNTELKWLGYSSDEVIGKKKFADLVTNSNLKIFEKKFSELKDSGSVNDLELELVRKDGSVLKILHSATAITNGEGKYLKSRSIIFDITELKQTEQNVALMNFALNHVNETAFLINEDAKLFYVNKEACNVLGYSEDELLNMNVADVDPGFPISRWKDHWNEIKTKRSMIFESRHRTKDGTFFPVEINANYFEYDGKGYNLALARNITERKQAEENIKNQMNEINRFNKLMIGREEKMIELKKEINLLLVKEGKPQKYDVH